MNNVIFNNAYYEIITSDKKDNIEELETIKNEMFNNIKIIDEKLKKIKSKKKIIDEINNIKKIIYLVFIVIFIAIFLMIIFLIRSNDK